MSLNYNFVLPRPHVKKVGGEYRFDGNHIEVYRQNSVIAYLLESGCHPTGHKIESDRDAEFKEYEKVENVDEDVDEILALMTPPTEENDWMVLKGTFLPEKFKDQYKRGFISGVGSVVQRILADKIPNEFGLNCSYRLFSTQKLVDVMYTDDLFNKLSNFYWIFPDEVIIGPEKYCDFSLHWGEGQDSPAISSLFLPMLQSIGVNLIAFEKIDNGE